MNYLDSFEDEIVFVIVDYEINKIVFVEDILKTSLNQIAILKT